MIIFAVENQANRIKMKTLSTLFLLLTAVVGLASAQTDDYPVAFPKDQNRTYDGRVLYSVGLGECKASVANTTKMYCDMTHRALVAKAGETVQPTLDFSTDWMHSYVYIDKNENGQFDANQPDEQGRLTADNDLVAFSALQMSDDLYYNSAGQVVNAWKLSPPTFTVPPTMKTGYYMMRYKVDWDSYDPAGRMDEGESIVKNGGAIVDVRLRIYDDDEVHVSMTGNGGTIKFLDGQQSSGTWTMGKPLPLLVKPNSGKCLRQLTVRHGNLTADSIVGRIAQYAEETIDCSAMRDGVVTLEGSLVDGDMEITAEFDYSPDGEATYFYELIFNDEFNQPDNSRPDSKKWRTSTRYGAVWNRWVSDRPEVAFIRDGALVCRAIPNPDTASDPVPMITGAKETRDKFSFTYGKVEVRLKTKRHTGNFPAAWMMPQPPCNGWPYSGEIDIFETKDNELRAYHTVHSEWTYVRGMAGSPRSSFNESVDVTDWHVYGLIWENNIIKWTVDGKEVASYAKSTDRDALVKGQWPFTAPFYLILNQSVGNGVWAANADTEYTYETMFDYIRVYRKKNVITGIDDVRPREIASGDAVFDMQGRKVLASKADGTLPKGIYISNGRKFVVK